VRQDGAVVVGGGGYDTVLIFSWSVNSIFTDASTLQHVDQLERSARIHKKYQWKENNEENQNTGEN
jgi:hypothetical protein